METNAYDGEIIAVRSHDPKAIFCYSPGIAIAETGRLILTVDLGGDGVANLIGAKRERACGTRFGQGKAFGSDDGGINWVSPN